jgi:tetratricopeptide (TPR) repeat protein
VRPARTCAVLLATLAALSSGACSSSNTKKPAEQLLNERMASVLLHDGRWLDAERAYRDCAKTDPKNPNVNDGLGIALFYQGKVRESIEWFDKAVKYAPEGALYRIHRGMARTQAGDYKAAEEDFQAASASATPDDQLDLSLQKGRLKQLQGNPRESEAYYNDALSRDPRNFTGLLGRGIARESQGHMDLAAQDYLEAVKVQPKNPDGNLRLGLALVALDRQGLGRRYLERTVELDPSGDAGSRARVALDSLGPEARKK